MQASRTLALLATGDEELTRGRPIRTNYINDEKNEEKLGTLMTALI